MLKLLIDQDLDHDILRGLFQRIPNLDAVTAFEIGLSKALDPDLSASIEALQRAKLELAAAMAQRSASIQAFEAGLDNAMAFLRRLDAVVANTLVANPAAMASWTVARTVVRAPSRRAAPKPAPPEVQSEPAPVITAVAA